MITQPSVAQASKACGLSETQIYARLKEPEFAKQYKEARRDLLTNCAAALQNRMGAATEKLAEVMDDDGTPAQARIQAASAILRFGLTLTEKVDILERLDELEQLIQEGRR